MEGIHSGAILQPRGGRFCNHGEVGFTTTRRKILQPRGVKNRPLFQWVCSAPRATRVRPGLADRCCGVWGACFPLSFPEAAAEQDEDGEKFQTADEHQSSQEDFGKVERNGMIGGDREVDYRK